MQALAAGVRPFTATKVVCSKNARRSTLVAQAQVQKSSETKQQLPTLVKPAALTVLSNIIMSLPAHAEAGKIFDFNFTLPIMMGEFLLLMVFLDKVWFGPVGKLLDERDASLREKLAIVKDNGADVAKLQAEASAILSDARTAAQKQIADAKSVVSAECAKELASAKAKVDAELGKALASLEAEKEAALKGMDAQVSKLSVEILSRVLPEGVKV